jgi:crotonobetainyl-CoA:carnitine CoA-transferase CaiB-like acyl-CoA transferase
VKHLGIPTPMHTENRGVLNVMRQPVSLSRTPSLIARPTPERGEHSEEILAEFGFSENEIAALRASGAI